ncbi:MAG: CoA transferase subunit A [Desulfobacter sp.]|nr:MAG: CoA transferase subunit A [Desulfobacter sp.]
MNVNGNKVMALKDAVEKFVTDGCHMSIGGFTINRNPMAAIYEMIRQGVKDLHLYAHSNGQGVDELVGAGCVANLEIAYGGTGKFMSTGLRFKKAVQDQAITVEDYSNYQMTLRFLAGAMGVPFLPTRSALGTDIVHKWGFSREFRQENQRIPDEKLVIMDNPFENWCNTEKVVLVPAINPDVTFIHVQTADITGNCRIDGLTFADVEQAKASKTLVITCESMVDDDYLKNEPDRNQIPFIHADAVVHVPFGAYPTACYNYYDYDPVYLNDHARAAKDEAAYRGYLETMILGQPDHHALLDHVGRARLERITADRNRGYAKDLDRK